ADIARSSRLDFPHLLDDCLPCGRRIIAKEPQQYQRLQILPLNPGESENLLSISDLISGPQEILIHAGALVRSPTLQCRPMSILHPYAPVERSPVAMSPVPEPRRRSVGHIPLPPRVQALLVQWL